MNIPLKMSIVTIRQAFWYKLVEMDTIIMATQNITETNQAHQLQLQGKLHLPTKMDY